MVIVTDSAGVNTTLTIPRTRDTQRASPCDYICYLFRYYNVGISCTKWTNVHAYVTISEITGGFSIGQVFPVNPHKLSTDNSRYNRGNNKALSVLHVYVKPRRTLGSLYLSHNVACYIDKNDDKAGSVVRLHLS